jgi:hypothetical protein
MEWPRSLLGSLRAPSDQVLHPADARERTGRCPGAEDAPFAIYARIPRSPGRSAQKQPAGSPNDSRMRTGNPFPRARGRARALCARAQGHGGDRFGEAPTRTRAPKECAPPMRPTGMDSCARNNASGERERSARVQAGYATRWPKLASQPAPTCKGPGDRKPHFPPKGGLFYAPAFSRTAGQESRDARAFRTTPFAPSNNRRC